MTPSVSDLHGHDLDLDLEREHCLAEGWALVVLFLTFAIWRSLSDEEE